MRKVTLTKLTAEAFRSFNSPHCHQLLLGGQFGLYFLRGQNLVEPRLDSNGSGKSSIWLALTWCIFGRTENLRTPDIKSWMGGIPKVTLYLTVDGVDHVIERVGKTNGLTIDGREVGPDAAAELIGISLSLWNACVALAQNRPLFLDLAAKEKLELLATAVNLSRWDDYAESAATKAKELESLMRELEGERAGLLHAVESTTELLERAVEASKAWQLDRDERLKVSVTSRQAIQDDLVEAKRALDDADLAYDSAMTEVKALKTAITSYRVDVSNAERMVRFEEVGLDRWRLARQNEEMHLANARKRGVCEECGQSLKLTHEHVLAQKKRLLGVDHSIARHEEAFENHSAALVKIQAMMQVKESQLVDLESKAEAALTTIHFRKPQVAEFETRLAMMADVEERNPHQDHVANLKRKGAQLTVSYKGTQADILKASKKIEQHRFWAREGFRDVKLQMLRELLEEMELVTNAMLPEIGLEGWRVGYGLEKETKAGALKSGIEVTISPMTRRGKVRQAKSKVHPNKATLQVGQGTVKTFFSWSGGEAQRLRLAASLALSQVLLAKIGVDINLLVLDEPTRGMTTSGVDELIDFLASLAQSQSKTIWLVDHIARESAKFVGGALVMKTEAGSVIQQGERQ